MGIEEKSQAGDAGSLLLHSELVRRVQINPRLIRLIAPEEGEMTKPLQQYSWQRIKNEAGTFGAWRFVVDGHDRSLPQAVVFHWEPLDLNISSLRYDMELSAQDGSGETIFRQDLKTSFARVENLRVGTRYLWRVRARQGQRLVGESKQGCFRTHADLPRWIHAPGTTNIRDLGGWPLPNGRHIRQGMFFRGSELNSHCKLEKDGHKVLVQDLRIRTDIDLRGPGEDRQPVLDIRRVNYVNIPLASYDMIAHPEYTGRYRALFSLLADPGVYPVFVHCWGGADRTGTVAFLLGALLGMRLEDLIHDYELTSLSIWGQRFSQDEAFQDMLQILELFAMEGSSLQTQVERYMHVIGLRDEEIESIRNILME